jgi:hypothetical protein
MEDRDRFQYEHIASQIVREAEAKGVSWQRMMQWIQTELLLHAPDYQPPSGSVTTES